MLVNRFFEKGDTLIEVLFAITIFSLVAVGGVSIMNQGTATSQRALEISMVRNEMDAQAETLRFLNASYIAAYQKGVTNYTGPAGEWAAIKAATASVTAASKFSSGTTCTTAPKDSFILNTRKAKLETVTGKFSGGVTYSQVKYDIADDIVKAEGIWIEAVKSAENTDVYQSSAGYIDFHIRTCWDGPGQSVPTTLGTIVRLYEPLYVAPIVPIVPIVVPIPNIPSAPSVSVLGTAGSNTTYSWAPVICDAGSTANYRYRYVIDYSGGFTSGWSNTAGLMSVYNTSSEGFQYSIQVQVECVNVSGVSSGWSASGTANYTRPVSAPGVIAWGITKPSANNVVISAGSTCSSTPFIYMYSRMDIYITPSYGGWNWWWGDTRVGGWYATSHGPWLVNDWNWYGNPVSVNMNMNPLWVGFPWRGAVELRCQNMVTGRSSVTTGRVESGDLRTP